MGRAAAGPGITCSAPKESRVNLFAARAGLLKINVPALEAINELPEVILSTLPNNTPVGQGEMVAGTKVIPLVVKEEVVKAAEEIGAASGGIVRAEPYRPLAAGIIVTAQLQQLPNILRSNHMPLAEDRPLKFPPHDFGDVVA